MSELRGEVSSPSPRGSGERVPEGRVRGIPPAATHPRHRPRLIRRVNPRLLERHRSSDRVLAAQPAVADAFEVAEDPVAVLGEDRELGAVLQGLVEGRFVVLADPFAGDGFVSDDAMPRPGDVGIGQAGIEAQDGGNDDECRADPVQRAAGGGARPRTPPGPPAESPRTTRRPFRETTASRSRTRRASTMAEAARAIGPGRPRAPAANLPRDRDRADGTAWPCGTPRSTGRIPPPGSRHSPGCSTRPRCETRRRAAIPGGPPTRGSRPASSRHRRPRARGRTFARAIPVPRRRRSPAGRCIRAIKAGTILCIAHAPRSRWRARLGISPLGRLDHRRGLGCDSRPVFRRFDRFQQSQHLRPIGRGHRRPGEDRVGFRRRQALGDDVPHVGDQARPGPIERPEARPSIVPRRGLCGPRPACVRPCAVRAVFAARPRRPICGDVPRRRRSGTPRRTTTPAATPASATTLTRSSLQLRRIGHVLKNPLCPRLDLRRSGAGNRPDEVPRVQATAPPIRRARSASVAISENFSVSGLNTVTARAGIADAGPLRPQGILESLRLSFLAPGRDSCRGPRNRRRSGDWPRGRAPRSGRAIRCPGPRSMSSVSVSGSPTRSDVGLADAARR